MSYVGDYTYSFAYFANNIINVVFPSLMVVDKDSQILDIFFTIQGGKAIGIVVRYFKSTT